MRISELAAISGTPVATIKYYVREGLLAGGERLGENRTEYTDEHAHRLRLIRSLLEVGKLSISSATAVLATLDDPSLPIAETFDVAQRALTRDAVSAVSDPTPESLARVDALVESVGWRECQGNVGRDIVAQVMDAFNRVGYPLKDEYFRSYAQAAEIAAGADLSEVGAIPDPADRTELMVVGTILGDSLALGLRRIAQAHMTAERGLR